ncbi:MAG TPA: DNA-3-methyladenine glycosylase I [Chloroflexia bacterium]|nr:DNA-3-methyladenine glycosylase I [Chloroflexia bacterium]
MLNETLGRCAWAGNNPLMIVYHDTEWGEPLHDDNRLFEFLCLEGAQAGLSWQTILNKRESYCRAFEGFIPERVAAYTENDIERLLADAGIVRNRLKITATISNARKFLEVQDEFGSFDRYIWQFVDNQPLVNRFQALSEIPARTSLSDAMSKDLLKRGFKFVGSTICYAFMQATGMVNDHTIGCFKYPSLTR